MNRIIDQWERAAERFTADQERSEYAAINMAFVKRRFQGLHGKTILDLGCGYGYYTHYFDEAGAHAIGVDGAEAMIQIARKRYPGSAFSIVDLSGPLPFQDASFDLVFCNQVLMDIENMEEVLRECHRVLMPGGTFWFSIVHPALYNGEWLIDENGYHRAKAMSRYLTEYVSHNHFWGKTTHFHRPISAYLNAVAGAGFAFVHADEPIAYDGALKNSDLPLFFFAEYEKRICE